MPRATIVVPAYNATATLVETLRSLFGQTFDDFEILVVDDGSTDGTCAFLRSLKNPRLRIVRQANRGLAGARNTGIAHARGEYIGFCDADDLWMPTKLAEHVAFLDANPAVGLSYSASALIDGDGKRMGISQTPKCSDVSATDVLLRNPVGNGSAAVMRRAALDDAAWRPAGETQRDWWFDETFRQSEDIEFWSRFALTTRWQIAGLEEELTLYRIVSGGLSANVDRQLETWERVAARVTELAPDFANRTVPAARAYQLRYLARRAVTSGNGRQALGLLVRACGQSLHPVWHEPKKTVVTLGAALVATLGGGALIARALDQKQKVSA